MTRFDSINKVLEELAKTVQAETQICDPLFQNPSRNKVRYLITNPLVHGYRLTLYIRLNDEIVKNLCNENQLGKTNLIHFSRRIYKHLDCQRKIKLLGVEQPIIWELFLTQNCRGLFT